VTRRGQEGQTLVLAAMVLAFLFVPLGVYVIDSGLVESGYAQLSETLQASAEDGASMIDESAYRSSGSAVLDPVSAREVADRSMQVSRLPGLESWTINVQGKTVTVTARLRVVLFAVGSTTITQARAARLAIGQ
jgi:hypothetical protein